MSGSRWNGGFLSSTMALSHWNFVTIDPFLPNVNYEVDVHTTRFNLSALVIFPDIGFQPNIFLVCDDEVDYFGHLLVSCNLLSTWVWICNLACLLTHLLNLASIWRERERHQCLQSGSIPTSVCGQIHLNPAAISFTPTLHFDQQRSFSILKPIFTLCSSTCLFNVLFCLPLTFNLNIYCIQWK